MADTGHVRYKCICNSGVCHFCAGGLFLCTICGGAEGSLPTNCPGRRMTREEQDAVEAGRLDFIGGLWVVPGEPNANT